MTYFIDDPREWRVSRSGYSIKTGWGDDKRIVASYHNPNSPFDQKRFEQWLEDAERICDLHNTTLSGRVIEDADDALLGTKKQPTPRQGNEHG